MNISTSEPVLRPAPLDKPDTSNLARLATDYLDQVETCEVEDELSDLEHYMFETVMTTFYGRDVWRFINSRLR